MLYICYILIHDVEKGIIVYAQVSAVPERESPSHQPGHYVRVCTSGLNILNPSAAVEMTTPGI